MSPAHRRMNEKVLVVMIMDSLVQVANAKCSDELKRKPPMKPAVIFAKRCQGEAVKYFLLAGIYRKFSIIMAIKVSIIKLLRVIIPKGMSSIPILMISTSKTKNINIPAPNPNVLIATLPPKIRKRHPMILDAFLCC